MAAHPTKMLETPHRFVLEAFKIFSYLATESRVALLLFSVSIVNVVGLVDRHAV